MDRTALVLKETGEVIDVKLMEGVEPEINSDVAGQYETFKSETVMIGMVKGGPVHSTDGYGFPEGTNVDRYGPGVTRIGDTRDTDAANNVQPVSHAKQRGTEPVAEQAPANTAANTAERDDSAKSGRTKPVARKR